MNNKCPIVIDLLPSFIDGICSSESNHFIEEHLQSCSACKHTYTQMNQEIKLDQEMSLMATAQLKEPFQKITQYFKLQSKFTNYIFFAMIITFIIGLFFLYVSLIDFDANQKEKKKHALLEQNQVEIMSDAFNILQSNHNIIEQSEKQLQSLYKKYNQHLQYLAVFPATKLESWLIKNHHVMEKPTRIPPIEYQNAVRVFGESGMIDPTKDHITPTDYDLGNIVMANENWIIQFEYKESYEPTIEKLHQINYFEPTILNIFQLPFNIFLLFTFLFIIWWNHRRIATDVEHIS